MGIWRNLFLFLMVLGVLIGCSNNGEEDGEEGTNDGEAESVELFVSAAASLTEAMDEVKEVYEAENNVTLTFNFAGSGKLAQQIQQGAPVDVFISANENWMDTLIEDEFIVPTTRVNVTGNKLVLITNNDSAIDYQVFEDMNVDELDQVAVGNPESVPAGEYTKEVLTAIDIWDEIEPRLVYAQDVRQVLTYVETGNAEIGFVYESDALSSDQVNVLAEADPSMHDAIIYPGGVTEESEQKEASRAFLEFLLSDTGQEILEKYGFVK